MSEVKMLSQTPLELVVSSPMDVAYIAVRYDRALCNGDYVMYKNHGTLLRKFDGENGLTYAVFGVLVNGRGPPGQLGVWCSPMKFPHKPIEQPVSPNDIIGTYSITISEQALKEQGIDFCLAVLSKHWKDSVFVVKNGKITAALSVPDSQKVKLIDFVQEVAKVQSN